MAKRMRLRSLLLAGGLVAAATAGAAGLPPLSENGHINGRLLAAAIGDEIRKNCPTISARMFTVLREARALESYALGLGYSRDEVERFLRSRDERRRIQAARDAYLARNGVVAGDAGSYCALGQREIADGSFIGSLLRAR
jgi:hypothetical protein